MTAKMQNNFINYLDSLVDAFKTAPRERFDKKENNFINYSD